MAAFRIQDFVDGQQVRPIHYGILAICMFVMFVDGLDIFLVGKIAPAIAQGMGEDPAAMTLVFFLQQIGLAIGAFAATPLADRYGRRRMLVYSATLFGVLTIATAFATTIVQLAILRGICGVFLAGGLPMAVALLAEHTPKQRRGTFIALSFAGYSAGSAAGGAIAAWLIDIYGWESGFIVAGVLPLLAVPIMLLFLPESLQFTANRNPHDPQIVKTIRRLSPETQLDGSEEFIAADGSKAVEKARLFDIFRGGRGTITTIIWLACFLSMGNIALMAAWLPTFFLEMAGIPIQQFAVLAMLGFFGGLAGTLAMGWLFDRVPASKLIPAYYFCLAGAIFALGVVPFHASVFIVALLTFNFFQTGGQTGLNTLMTRVYPASMRSTGIGWAGGAGRIGGIIAPLFGGLAVAAQYSLQTTLSAIAFIPLLVGLLLLMLPMDQATADEPVRPAA
jgi:MFS transporter, AAHS family, 4-hydroxybenzoate transporter